MNKILSKNSHTGAFGYAARGLVLLVLVACLCCQLIAQSGSCETCADKNNIRIKFVTVMCADKDINVTLNGATASTPGGDCTEDAFATSDIARSMYEVLPASFCPHRSRLLGCGGQVEKNIDPLNCQG